MRKFLVFLIAAVFLLSPIGPSWGPLVVKLGVGLVVFNFFVKFVPKRRYH
jgi:thiol:disulfide interchange protein